MHQEYQRKIESRFEVNAVFRDANGVEQFEKSQIDFSYLKGMTQLGEPPLQKMADEMEKIRKTIDGVVSSGRVNARIYTEKNIREENERMQKRFDEYEKTNI